ncbi:family 1 glycosylhydrolase [Allosphingosinicella vermicomposti]|uniref:family 1 glycosylhydrolase n=1 Tax=Allosphingosinicella vermicomposti TaxID=614671 RepID=UPI001FE15C69|nr:family 1 glycosylhydrolase [Allosphingosinicella vermicomposti]
MTNGLMHPGGKLELWGGVECSVVRVGDGWRDELAETGHSLRADDIDLIADLGVTAVRYPILWERIAPEDPDQLDFTWTDERLGRLRARGVRVIGGLCHHGSGPHYTDLLDPAFPKKLANFAARVAERYPWIEDWTPVNEPLTTARFSALYDHWYPHARDFGSFLRALAFQCHGVLKAMRAIRSINPSARLIQTEDLGKTFSTAPLRYQAAHENERRWLSFDLLCGRVCPGHAFHDWMLKSGVPATLLDDLASGEARPDLIGINHYLTSERFLDHRVELYPDVEPGGNGRDIYIDAEAVRVGRLDGKAGFEHRLREAWQRYKIPLAITEVHHGCTRDEQLRWFVEVWNTAGQLRGEGVDLRAVTVWSLFGNVDWRSLLTRREGVYDVGAFDARAPTPRPTILASAARAFATGQTFDHPVLDLPGWWRRPERLYPWNGRKLGCGPGRKLLITGATGTLGRAFSRIAEHRGLPNCLTSRSELDLCDAQSIRRAQDEHRPWAIINAAGFVRVADAERERDACFAANSLGPQRLAEACAEAGVPFVTFSSDLVFNGRAGPYWEDDPLDPLGVYGLSKADGEGRVLSISGDALMIRTAAFFGPWDEYNFAWAILNGLARGEPVGACPNTVVSPTYVPDLCHATLDLLIDGEKGVWHLTNQGSLSWHEFARRIADRAGYDGSLIAPVPSGEGANTALISRCGALLRPVDHAIDDFVAQVRPKILA